MKGTEEKVQKVLCYIEQHPGAKFTEIEASGVVDRCHVQNVLRILNRKNLIFKAAHRRGGYFPIKMIGVNGLKRYTPKPRLSPGRLRDLGNWTPQMFWGHRVYEADDRRATNS